MITSGIVITLNADAALARQAQENLAARPELTLGELSARWLPVALESADVGASRDFHDWLNTVPGVDFADVVEVSFEEEEILPSREVSVNARPHPNPLPRGEGTANVRSPVIGNSSAQSHRGFSSETANISPSPGGEGRGEGERQTIPCQTFPGTAATNEFIPQGDL